MSTETRSSVTSQDLIDRCIEFYRNYYRKEIGQLAQQYPNEQRSLAVDYSDVYNFDPDIADDYLNEPKQMQEYFEEALRLFDLPVEVSLDRAHIRVFNLPKLYTFYPGHFSPAEHRGCYREVTGEVSKATDTYARMTHAAFECQRCGTLTQIPQQDNDFQEPNECQGCERQGPFQINYDQSEFIDARKVKVQTPPEIAQGDGQEIEVFIEDDLTDQLEVGDQVTIAGTVNLEQKISGRKKTGKFKPYLDGQSVVVEQTDAEDVDVSQEERKQIEALANGEKGDPFDLAVQSYSTDIYGYEKIKKALLLSLVGGARKNYDGGSDGRGEFHVLLIGDPSTAKSNLIGRAEDIGWRAVGVSGTGATKAGVTATAVQDDFGDGGWTLDAGAFVLANRGVVAIDELDDTPEEVRAAMLEPMSNQSIHISKGGINTRLETRTAVVAAANPHHNRFDPYEPIPQQVSFSATLLSRFDLVYILQDQPEEERDTELADHVLKGMDAAKRKERDMKPLDDVDDQSPPVDEEILRKWVALAKQQPKPVFANREVREKFKESYTTLRGFYNYEESDPVPVTLRSLEGSVRVAEAAAKFEFSDTIEERHAEIALDLVGQSMQDVGRDTEGKLDADIHETGESKAERDRKKSVADQIQQMQSENDERMVERDAIVEHFEDKEDIEERYVTHDIDSFLENGTAIEPKKGYIRYIGKG